MNMSCKDLNRGKRTYLAPAIKIVDVRSQAPLIAYSGTFAFKDSEKEYFA